MAKHKHIVKINEDQYEFLKGGDTKHFNGNSEVCVGGQLNPDEDGIPKTTDEIGSMVTAQGYNRWPRRYMNFKESVDKPSNGDLNGDGIDNFYQDKLNDRLSNGNPDDNLTVVPNSIETRVEALMKLINSSNLNAMQLTNVLNEILQSLDLSKLTYKQKKELFLNFGSKR